MLPAIKTPNNISRGKHTATSSSFSEKEDSIKENFLDDIESNNSEDLDEHDEKQD